MSNIKKNGLWSQPNRNLSDYKMLIFYKVNGCFCSLCLCPFLHKLSEHVGRHYISTKFYNQQNPPCTPEFLPLHCPKLGFTLSNQRVFITSLSNLVNMLVCIMSWPSSITSQIPQGTPELWLFNCPKLSKIRVCTCKLSKSKSVGPVFIKPDKYVGGHNISTKFYNQPNPPCTLELCTHCQ